MLVDEGSTTFTMTAMQVGLVEIYRSYQPDWLFPALPLEAMYCFCMLVELPLGSFTFQLACCYGFVTSLQLLSQKADLRGLLVVRAFGPAHTFIKVVGNLSKSQL